MRAVAIVWSANAAPHEGIEESQMLHPIRGDPMATESTVFLYLVLRAAVGLHDASSFGGIVAATAATLGITNLSVRSRRFRLSR
jgi:hypothetical protein